MNALVPLVESQPTIESVLLQLNPHLDPRDQQILLNRGGLYIERREVQVGDFVEMPDLTLRRFTYDWGDDIQVTSGAGSFYLASCGGNYSGALDPPIAKCRLQDSGQTRSGRFWFFRHGHRRAYNGVDVFIPCRMWMVSRCQ